MKNLLDFLEKQLALSTEKQKELEAKVRSEQLSHLKEIDRLIEKNNKIKLEEWHSKLSSLVI